MIEVLHHRRRSSTVIKPEPPSPEQPVVTTYLNVQGKVVTAEAFRAALPRVFAANCSGATTREITFGAYGPQFFEVGQG